MRNYWHYIHFLGPLIALTASSVLDPVAVNAQPVYDGFNVYCTSNLDSTGVCVNMETNRSLKCIIIPGQVIDCRSRSGKSFQCVLYSQYTANQAEFFCDPAVDRMLGQESGAEGSEAFFDAFPDPL